MNTLLSEIVGWLAYLERPAVLLQLGLTLAVMALSGQGRRRAWWPGLPALAYPALGLGLQGLVTLALATARLPWGLASLLGQLWLGWYGISLLMVPLNRWLPEAQAHQLESRLLRPGYLLFGVLLLISCVDSLSDLAVIEMGQLLGVRVMAGRVFDAVLLLYVVLVACEPPAAGLAWLLQKAVGMSDGSRKATELMLRYLVVALGLAAIAMHLGFNPNALIAIAGGLSVGLGFGIKEVFSNFVSGLWLLFEGSVRPGEVLMLDGDPCEVRRLGLRATLLWRDRDNAELLIPNQTFFTQAATTYTASDRMRRSQVNVTAAYHHDPQTVIALLQATALEVTRVLPSPAPKALLVSYGDYAINYALRFWIANPMDNGSICSEVNQVIWHAFKREGIEMPFPQSVDYAMVWPPEQHRPNV